VPDGESVLEIGCGTGRNLLRVAETYPQARVHGLDISSEMLKTARTAISKAGLQNHIRLGLGDATAFNALVAFGQNTFARIFFSYTLSMVPDWRRAVERAALLLPPEGELHIVDFGNGEGLPDWSRQTLHTWLGRFGVAPRVELSEATAPAGLDDFAIWRTNLLYRGYAVRAVLKRR
jgi:S-adenosylmethionine-diacylgycerolhomoserine-N-methlytransferase